MKRPSFESYSRAPGVLDAVDEAPCVWLPGWGLGPSLISERIHVTARDRALQTIHRDARCAMRVGHQELDRRTVGSHSDRRTVEVVVPGRRRSVGGLVQADFAGGEVERRTLRIVTDQAFTVSVVDEAGVPGRTRDRREVAFGVPREGVRVAPDSAGRHVATGVVALSVSRRASRAGRRDTGDRVRPWSRGRRVGEGRCRVASRLVIHQLGAVAGGVVRVGLPIRRRTTERRCRLGIGTGTGRSPRLNRSTEVVLREALTVHYRAGRVSDRRK